MIYTFSKNKFISNKPKNITNPNKPSPSSCNINLRASTNLQPHFETGISYSKTLIDILPINKNVIKSVTNPIIITSNNYELNLDIAIYVKIYKDNTLLSYETYKNILLSPKDIIIIKITNCIYEKIVYKNIVLIPHNTHTINIRKFINSDTNMLFDYGDRNTLSTVYKNSKLHVFCCEPREISFQKCGVTRRTNTMTCENHMIFDYDFFKPDLSYPGFVQSYQINFDNNINNCKHEISTENNYLINNYQDVIITSWKTADFNINNKNLIVYCSHPGSYTLVKNSIIGKTTCSKNH